MGYEIMKKDTVEVLDSQTAKTESEPPTVSLEEIKTEVAYTCKSKCDSCEFDYQERSIV